MSPPTRANAISTLACAAALASTACPGDRSAPLAPEPAIARAEPIPPAAPLRCRPLADERCCPSDYGFDPRLALAQCGFAEYLGEREDLVCAQRFRSASGEVIELTIAAVLGLDQRAAITEHQRSFVGREHEAGEWPLREGAIAWTRLDGRSWAFVPGWSLPRRVSWPSEACDDASMQVVLQAMSEAPFDPAAAQPLLHYPSTDVSAPTGLLAREWPAAPTLPLALPDHALTLVEALLASAAAGEREAMLALLDADARWGLPDRRMLAARPVHEGRELLPALRQAAARLPADAEPSCPAPDRRSWPAIARGEQPIWCWWASADGLDLLAIRLRGSVDEGGRIDYVGVFPSPPTRLLAIAGEPPPPPLLPTPPLVCGDPHAVHYPELCPRAAEVDETVDADEADAQP